MSVLSDRQFLGMYHNSKSVGPASMDLHVGSTLWFWPSHQRRDPRLDESDIWKWCPLDPDDQVWILEPGIRYLAATRERIRIPNDCAGQISARSSWGRDGLAVICGPAGWCDPGYVGNPTLELSVIGSELVLWPGAAVCQLILHRLETECLRPYGHPDRESKYQGDADAQPSRLYVEVQG